MKIHIYKKRLLSGILSLIAGIVLSAGIASCADKEAKVSLEFPDDFNGKTLDLISFNDSVLVATTQITDGKAEFTLTQSDSLVMPLLAQFVVDGRVKGYYVIEPGEAVWTDTIRVARGTPSNARFAELLGRIKEADEAEDFVALTSISERIYNENKNNIFGPYFGIEWLKWADPLKVDSLLAKAPDSFRNSRRAAGYIDFARLRARTAPGQPYADFSGKDASGKDIKFSDYVTPGKYVIVEFMASWCPYCIKDLPELKRIYSANKDKGVELVSVAVRDTPEATAGAVKKHGMDWKVVYDAQKRPYDLYGFSGIPHYMLIGPDGKIAARSMKLSDIDSALSEKLQ